MVVALVGIAFAMIVGGLAAIVMGYPIIIVERGWALVISGAVAASGGAVVLGVAVVAARIARVEAELAKSRGRAGRPEVVFPEPPPGLAALQAEPSPGGSRADPPLAAAASVAPTIASPPPERSAPPEPEPSVPITEPIHLAEERGAPVAETAGPPAREEFGRPELRDTLPADEPSAVPASAPPPDDEDLFEEPTRSPSLDVGFSRDPKPMPDEPAPAEPAAVEPAAKPQPAVVGRYASGGNSYTMFADGSIEAETPTGLYRFDSLDELKEFIASGGEGGSAAAT